MDTYARPRAVGFTADRIAALKDAQRVLNEMRDEAAQAAYGAPSHVMADGVKAQAWGALSEALGIAEGAITHALIVADVSCDAGDLLGLDDDDEAA